VTPTVLTIAGSDSGGGAGIQADLKAFARCGVHGTSAITAITAQNTVGVISVQMLAPELVQAQARAVLADIEVHAVKLGMLGTAAVIAAVAEVLAELDPGTPIVLDPVMVAESGASLLAPEAIAALVELILPIASVITPNLPEARTLAPAAGSGAGDDGEAELLTRAVLALGPGAVVLTGGHRWRAVDVFLDSADGQLVEIPGERMPDGAAHGSGCTHASVLAAQLALGHTPLEAARTARVRAGEAVANGLRDVGAGAGPVDVIGLRALRER
jgi:hydroxymethylpyrimidine/phosphomethylpyrimidine kinase